MYAQSSFRFFTSAGASLGFGLSKSNPTRRIERAAIASARNTPRSPSVNPPKLYTRPNGRDCVVATVRPSNRGAHVSTAATLSPWACTTAIAPRRFASIWSRTSPSRSVTRTCGTRPPFRSTDVASSAATTTFVSRSSSPPRPGAFRHGHGLVQQDPREGVERDPVPAQLRVQDLRGPLVLLAGEPEVLEDARVVRLPLLEVHLRHRRLSDASCPRRVSPRARGTWTRPR